MSVGSMPGTAPQVELPAASQEQTLPHDDATNCRSSTSAQCRPGAGVTREM